MTPNPTLLSFRKCFKCVVNIGGNSAPDHIGGIRGIEVGSKGYRHRSGAPALEVSAGVGIVRSR